jgi:membrane-associated phospholipid phosphatase
VARFEGRGRLAPAHAGATSAITTAIALLLGLRFAGDRTPGPIDQAIMTWISESTAAQDALLRLLVLPTQPFVLLPLIALITLAALLDGRRVGAVLALVGPAAAVAVNTWVLKPMFGRYYDDHLAYPSGHTVSLVAVLGALALLARPGLATRLVVAIGVLLVVGACVGMIGLGYHYLTDVVGGVAFAVAAILGIAAALDVLARSRKVAESAR